MPRALQHSGGLPTGDGERTLESDLRAYRGMIEELETRGGAYDASLAEPLLGLGRALQRAGDHGAAIRALKRGVHLARINDGLYSERQVALLQAEIASHVALGDYEAADERQRYLYRVQVRALSAVPRGTALMQHAQWQRRAFEARLDEEPGQRLLRMWALYQLALTEIAESEGESSPTLLPPLYGMLRAQYLLTGFVGETTTGQFTTAAPWGDWEEQQRLYRGQSYDRGASVIRAIHDVRRAQDENTLRHTAEALLMLGDWQLWNGKRMDAMETYAELDQELAAIEGAQALRAAFFAEPQPLPALEGVRALPPARGAGESPLLLQFGVTDNGRVVDVERLDEHPANDTQADDIMRRLRRTLFRPRISDGIAVDTAEVVRAYDIADW